LSVAVVGTSHSEFVVWWERPKRGSALARTATTRTAI
jgi:hypothetical protein